jgi:hypothetical protein
MEQKNNSFKNDKRGIKEGLKTNKTEIKNKKNISLKYVYHLFYINFIPYIKLLKMIGILRKLQFGGIQNPRT